MGSHSVETSTTMIKNPLDPEEFRRQGHLVIDFLADYYQNIEKYPVRSQVKPGYLIESMPKSAPFHPEPIETILQDVQQHIIPGITHWQSPNFFGYFQSNGSTANFLGEMLLTGFNSVGFNWMASPAATELEMIVMEWLLKLLHLPKSFSFSSNGGGVIHGSTCESLVCTMVTAKERKLNQIGEKNLKNLVIYCSDQTHFSLQKASRIIGVSPNNVKALITTKATNFQLSQNSLRMAVEADVKKGLIPFFLCLTIGTTPTTAVDPLGSLCDLAKEFDMWVHVDAAYAGSACICPEFRHFLDGVEGANSFSFNPHKWFLTSLDCCCLWVKNRIEFIGALSTNDPELLKNNVSDSKRVVDYKDWQISLSRRFRAMKLWLVMRSYGEKGIQEFIRSHVKMAKNFEQLVSKNPNFELVVPRNFSMVCFRFSPLMIKPGLKNNEEVLNDLNKDLLESLNESGRVYMTHAIVGGVYVIRFAVGATLTDETHVNMVWKLVQEHGSALITNFTADITLKRRGNT